MTESGGEDSDLRDDTAILSDSDGGVSDDTASGLTPKDDGRGGGCDGCRGRGGAVSSGQSTASIGRSTTRSASVDDRTIFSNI